MTAAGPCLLLEQLGPRHGAAILAGQDEALAREVVGGRWEPESLREFLERASRWGDDGPVRELAAVVPDAEGTALVGGGGITSLGPGLERGEASLSYWLLPAHRGCGLGPVLAARLVDLARADDRIGTLVLRISPDNAASRAVARSLGAGPVGRSERHPADATRRVDRWELSVRSSPSDDLRRAPHDDGRRLRPRG